MDLKEKQIIYMDNKPHIKCNLVMLYTTDKLAPLSINQGYLIREFYNSVSKSLQHLYITSDEEIKEGDWYIFNVGYASGVKQADLDDIENIHLEIDPKKIIATTDTSLELPQPSQQFIEKYIEEYNKGNIITEVLIEVEEYEFKQTEWFQEAPYTHKYKEWRLKLDSQNQITIRKIKDSWNREEVIDLCRSAYLYGEQGALKLHNGIFKEWIEENLYNQRNFR